MSKKRQPSRQLRSRATFGALYFALAFSLALPVLAQANTIDDLKNCARMQDNSARIACYEALGARVLQQDAQDTSAVPVKNQGGGKDQASNVDRSPRLPAPSTPSTSTAMESTVKTIPDDLGKTRKGHNEKAEEYTGHVSSCQKAHDRQWFYFFDNGQVWKQVDRKRRYYKECNFNATITKDAFGFSFQVDGEGPKTRIRRHR